MKIEEFVTLARRIATLDDLLTKLEKNDKYYVVFKSELDAELTNIFIDNPEYKDRIFNELNDEYVVLKDRYLTIDAGLKKLDTSAEEILNKYMDSKQNAVFIEELMPAYKTNNAITFAFMDKTGNQRDHVIRYDESTVNDLLNLLKKFNDDAEKFVEYNMLKVSEELNLDEPLNITALDDESDEYLDEPDQIAE